MAINMSACSNVTDYRPQDLQLYLYLTQHDFVVIWKQHEDCSNAIHLRTVVGNELKAAQDVTSSVQLLKKVLKVCRFRLNKHLKATVVEDF